MVEAKKSAFTKIASQPAKLMIDLSFWLEFTRCKLDYWKLETPQVDVHATVSLPANQNLPSDLILNSQSLGMKPHKKVIGGLVTSVVPGTLIHTNTIEEYNALDIESILK